ncbi:putative serine/threonine-protein kinase [Glycine soja]
MGEIKEECTSPDKRKVALYSSGESKATAIATNGLCEENVNGEGGYGSVYRGLFPDGTKVARDLDLICPKGLQTCLVALLSRLIDLVHQDQFSKLKPVEGQLGHALTTTMNRGCHRSTKPVDLHWIFRLSISPLMAWFHHSKGLVGSISSATYPV